MTSPSPEQKLIEALEQGRKLCDRLYYAQSHADCTAKFNAAINDARAIFTELAELREKVSKMEDNWYSPQHMDAVEERTIKPLREKAAVLEWLIDTAPNELIDIFGDAEPGTDPVPKIIRQMIEQRKCSK